MATSSTAPSQSNPLAWAQWAATQDPSAYVIDAAQSLNTSNLGDYKQALTQAGLWDPSYDAYLTQAGSVQGAAAGDTGSSSNTVMDQNGNIINSQNGQMIMSAPDLSKLAGYQVGTDRGPGYSNQQYVTDSKGNVVGNSAYNNQQSMHTGDYVTALSTIAAGMGGAYALGGAGAFGAGAAATEGGGLAGMGGASAMTPAQIEAAAAAGSGNAAVGAAAADTAAGSGIGSYSAAANYGVGMTGAQTSMYDAAISAGMSPAEAAAAADFSTALPAATDLATGASVAQLTTTAAPIAGGTGGLGTLGTIAAGTGAVDALATGQTPPVSNPTADLSQSPLQSPGAGPTSPGILSQLAQFAAQNPKLAIQLAGLLGGGISKLFGGAGANGTAPSAITSLSNSQSNLIANSQPALNAAYSNRVATPPPAGYKGAEDPRGQWDWFNQANNARFFNGIGSLSPTPAPTPSTGQPQPNMNIGQVNVPPANQQPGVAYLT